MMSQQHPLLGKQQEEMLTPQSQQCLDLQASKNFLDGRRITSLDRNALLSRHQ
jgi:hypothetical protein